MRSSSLFRFFLALLMSAGILLVAEPTLGQYCRFPTEADGNWSVVPDETCPGGNPQYEVTHWGSIAVHSHITCENSGWKTDIVSIGSYSISGSGMCGNAPAGIDPLCPPYFGVPWLVRETSSQVFMRGGVEASTSTSWGGCDYRPIEYVEQSFSVEDGCCGAICNDPGACTFVGEWDAANCRCVISPIVLDLDGDGFQLTSWEDGVRFDLACTDSDAQTAWTRRGTHDAFLALDRDEDGTIDSGCELFGSATPQPYNAHPNGFEALRPFDLNGDSMIDRDDPVYPSLRVWTDRNHDGVSQPREVKSFSEAGIVEISLQYKESRRRDEYGNLFRYAAKVKARSNGALQTRWAVDVFFAGQPACPTGGAGLRSSLTPTAR